MLIRGPTFKCYAMQWRVGGIRNSTDDHYEGVWSNIISVTRGCCGECSIIEKKELRNT